VSFFAFGAIFIPEIVIRITPNVGPFPGLFRGKRLGMAALCNIEMS
jgi:hypothetical protein